MDEFYIIEIDVGENNMQNLTELEHILDNLDFLADTFLALDVVNQNRAYIIPQFALTVPAEIMKQYTERAKMIFDELIKEKTANK